MYTKLTYTNFNVENLTYFRIGLLSYIICNIYPNIYVSYLPDNQINLKDIFFLNVQEILYNDYKQLRLSLLL